MYRAPNNKNEEDDENTECRNADGPQPKST